MKQMMELSLEYCSVGCNNTPLCLTWSSSGRMLYGAANALIEYDFEANEGCGSVVDVDFSHKDKITSVSSSKRSILTTSRDGCCVLRQHHSTPIRLEASAAQMCGDVVDTDDATQTWAVSGGSDNSVHVWRIEDGCERKICALTYDAQTPLCVRIFKAYGTVLLFIGWTSCEVQALALEDDDCFKQICKLRGHEDWVRGIDVRQHEGDLFVATCAQDNFIRVWRISSLRETNDQHVEGEKVHFNVKGKNLQAQLETVLEGHTGWIFSVKWHPTELQLLSASIDKSIIVWKPSDDCDVWIDAVRVGEVGGNNLGFFAAVWDLKGERILGSGFRGSFHLWKMIDGDRETWMPCVVPGGHFNPVKSISWSPSGNYLLSCSNDQTTRLHARWSQNKSWKELARPQVHGHDLACISCLSDTSFVSGAEEKVLRVFSATRNFAENFSRISGVELTHKDEASKLPEGASVAALGLSNKAVSRADLKLQMQNADCGADDAQRQQEDFYFRPVELTTPPNEATLAQNTLWHEVRKLYGHGYELFTVAASPNGTMIASACKAQSAKHAAVILWDTTNWSIVQKLEHHQLTVTRIVFSWNGERILTVSRDRTWALWQKCADDFVKIASVNKTCSIHQRIIWSCAFGPKDVDIFATCSRDKRVVIWACSEAQHCLIKRNFAPKQTFTFEDSVTAVAFSPTVNAQGTFVLAAGLDNGAVELRHMKFIDGELSVEESQRFRWHDSTVNAIEFCPDDDTTQCLIASCSNDHSVKIHRLL